MTGNDFPCFVGAKIREIRLRNKLTQTQLGKLLGVSGVAVMRYEKGTRQPNLQMLFKLSEALDVPIYFLFSQERAEKEQCPTTDTTPASSSASTPVS